jgi:SNF2 family DNA or RNA helicase
MQPKQGALYNKLVEDSLAELESGELILTQSTMVKIIRLRQILCCPRILDPSFPEYGACIEHLGEMLDDTDDHHFVVFTPFVDAIPHIKEYLTTKLSDLTIDPITLQGGLKAEEVQQRINLYRENEGIAICSIAYAESFELVHAKWAYMNGYSWDAIENIQAEDRLHRFTTKSVVNYYYPFHAGCIDEELIMPALDDKSTQISRVTKDATFIRDLLKRQRQLQLQHH